MNSSNKGSRLPNLGKLSIAILERYVSPFIGDQAIEVLREPYKRNLLLRSLKDALERTESKFIQKNPDQDIRDLLLQLPLSGDHDLGNALFEFSSNPSSQSLEQVLNKKIKSYAPTLEDDRVRIGVLNYIDILRFELLSNPEVREVLVAWASINASRAISDVEKKSSFALDELRKIAENTKELVSVAKQTAPQIQPLHADSGSNAQSKEVKFTEIYVERAADKKLIRELRNNGVTITIKGPSKMGKTFLVQRALAKIARRKITIDFSQFDNIIFRNAGAFYRRFYHSIAIQLGIRSGIMDQWDSSLSSTLLMTGFFENEVFIHTKDEPLILILDNADRLLGTELGADLFPLLRYWHNQRSEGRGWDRLDMIIVISTEPKLLIANATESPFNVSTIVNIGEFTFDQVVELNASYDELFNAGELNLLFKLLNGHPYLTQLAFASIIQGQVTKKDLLDNPLKSNSPFLPFLNTLLMDLTSNAEIHEALRTILHQHATPGTYDHIYRLQSLGIIHLAENQILLRNKLYRIYFQANL